MTGEEIVRELGSVLSVRYAISTKFLLGAMCDSTSVNNAALWTMKVVFPNVLHGGCFSYMLDIVDGKFSTPHLNDFMMALVSLFNHT